MIVSLTEQYKKRGLTLRYGRWTIQEKKQLHKNFEDFINDNEDEIGNPVDFTTPSDDRSRAREVTR